MNWGKNGAARVVRGGATLMLAMFGWVASMRAEATWLAPERFAATPGALLAFDVLTAPEFGGPDAAVSGNVLRELTGVLGDEPILVVPTAAAGAQPRLAATLPKPGVAVVSADLAEEIRTRKRESVEAYLLALHASETVVARWAELPPDTVWREKRTVRLKTFVRVGEPPAHDFPWSRHREEGLDIVPERDPTTVPPGGALPIRVYRDGVPVPGLLVTYLSRGETREHVVVTDGAGRASAELEATGPWMIRANVVEAERAPDHDWRTETVVVTLEVR